MKAWVENGTVRDVAPGNPADLYHPAIAAFYTVDVPAGTLPGATLVEGVWTNPPPPAPVPPPPPAAVTIEQVQAAVQLRLDTFARTRAYDGILSACTYATSSIERFRLEGQCCVDVRDATWAACYAILAEVESGTRPPPTTVEAVMAELPELAWPEAG